MRPSIFRVFPGVVMMGFVLFFLPFLLLKLAFLLLIGSIAMRLIFRRPRYYQYHGYHPYHSRTDTIYAIPEEEYDMPFRGRMNTNRHYGYRSRPFQPDESVYRERDFVTPIIKV